MVDGPRGGASRDDWVVRVPASSANLGSAFDAVALGARCASRGDCRPTKITRRKRIRRCGRFATAAGSGRSRFGSDSPAVAGLGFSGAARVGGLVAAYAQQRRSLRDVAPGDPACRGRPRGSLRQCRRVALRWGGRRRGRPGRPDPAARTTSASWCGLPTARRRRARPAACCPTRSRSPTPPSTSGAPRCWSRRWPRATPARCGSRPRTGCTRTAGWPGAHDTRHAIEAALDGGRVRGLAVGIGSVRGGARRTRVRRGDRGRASGRRTHAHPRHRRHRRDDHDPRRSPLTIV